MRKGKIRKLMTASIVLMLLATLGVFSSLAQTGDEPPGKEPGAAETAAPGEIELLPVDAPGGMGGSSAGLGRSPQAVMGQVFVYEVEPNNTSAQATPFGSGDAVALGNVFPNGDVDYYSFQASAGDRVYAATMTSFSASASTDSVLDLLDTDGVTLLESDDNNGSFGGSSSSLAGTLIPADGTYFLQVRHFTANGQLRPYHLHLKVQSGAPGAEVEPNDLPSSAMPLPPSGWVAGDTSAITDVDYYSLTLNAGDTVFLSLDLDPERDATEWSGRLGFGVFNNNILVVNDAGDVGADSEAFFLTVLQSGTYYVYIDNGGGGTFGSYHLSASIHPAAAQSCTTYTSTDVPKTIPDGPGSVTSVLSIPGNPRIADLNVFLDLTHAFMTDLDVTLTSPTGNESGLFTDIGSNSQTIMNIEIDDDAGLPLGLYTVVSGMVNQPELAYRLSWFDGQEAGGTWTLTLHDDASPDGGTLNNWGMTICEPAPPPACPAGTAEVTLFSTDFEVDDGGFTHSGTADEWEWGMPVFAPITNCSSGLGCWKTDLDNTYDANSSQDLLSPAIDLGVSGIYAPVRLSWAQKYQMESATFDHASVDVQQVGGGNPRRLWEFLDATMTTSVGNPAVTVQESAGWGIYSRDISDYLGEAIELRYHLDSDTTVQLGGLAVDDVTVTACRGVPEISVEKTVGTDPTVCATTKSITVDEGTDVTYCYQVTNTGLLDLSRHTLEDSQLGVILNDLAYTLSPGASAFLTSTVNITQTTVNTATWTAYNPGPVDLATATDTATVTVFEPQPEISLQKTVGTDPNVCAVTDSITVPQGTDVTYCYEVNNTGNITLTQHTLQDSELGVLLNDFAYSLAPGASAFITSTVQITQTTVNTATWTAYNPGPVDTAQAADTATVNVTVTEVKFEIYLPVIYKNHE